MSYNAKYITYMDQYGSTVAVIFGTGQNHLQIALNLGIQTKVESAGFVEIDELGIRVGGKSESLGIKAKTDLDKSVIARMLGYEKQMYGRTR